MRVEISIRISMRIEIQPEPLDSIGMFLPTLHRGTKCIPALSPLIVLSENWDEMGTHWGDYDTPQWVPCSQMFLRPPKTIE